MKIIVVFFFFYNYLLNMIHYLFSIMGSFRSLILAIVSCNEIHQSQCGHIEQWSRRKRI